MKNTIITVIYSQILFLLLTCNLATAEGQPVLQKVRHTVLSSTSEQVTLQLNGSYSPKVFTLKGETPRIVFDFPDMTHSREVQGTATTKGALIKRIRVGMHTDTTLKTRIVFDVATLQGITYNQKFDEKSSTLTIQFTADAKTAAADTAKKSAKEKTFDAQPVQTPLAVTSDPKSLPKTETVQTGSEAKSQSETKLQATSSAEKAEEITTPPASTATKPQPEVTADISSSAKTKTTQTESNAKPQSTAPEASKKPAVTAETSEEKKKPAPVAPAPVAPAPVASPPQPVITTDTKPSAKTEAVKPAATAGGTVGSLIESIKFDGTSPKGEMVLFKLNDFHPPVIHGVEEGVPRVICDFNSTQINDSVKNLIKADGKYVKIIRVSKHKKPERIRVVLDLEPNRSYDLQQVFFKEDNLFVIIVNAIKK